MKSRADAQDINDANQQGADVRKCHQAPHRPQDSELRPRPLRVAIVGGGTAGLYTALLLQQQGVDFHIFEGTDRVGGRVYTHYFNTDKDQFVEVGAMRIPETSFQSIFFDLVKYLNEMQKINYPNRHIELIPYIYNMKGNEAYINGTFVKLSDHEYESADVSIDSIITPYMINWVVPDDFRYRTAGCLMQQAIKPFQDYIEKAIEEGYFEKAFRHLVHHYDDYSFRYYLHHKISTDINQKEWVYPTSVIDFLETVTNQTNQFALSFPELLMQNMDFGTKKWWTIQGGMSELAESMADLIGRENITFGARVTRIRALSLKPKDHTLRVDNIDHRRVFGPSVPVATSGRVEVVAVGCNGEISDVFDKVVFAIPPAALKMIVARPLWSPEKEMAIRSVYFAPLYKMGLRFKRRFWEHVKPASKGGQSVTDMPIRWIVYPSNGISSNDKAPGVLTIYAWSQDATTWVPLSAMERRSLALYCLEKIYKDRIFDNKGNPITVTSLLIETFDVVWSASTATGDAAFLPGQFEARFDASRQSEMNTFYFTGEHNSFHHTWITGAAESALWTVRDMLGDQSILPLSDYTAKHLRKASDARKFCPHARDVLTSTVIMGR